MDVSVGCWSVVIDISVYMWEVDDCGPVVIDISGYIWEVDDCGPVVIDISVYIGAVDNCGIWSIKAMSFEPINRLLDITGAITKPVSRYKNLN